MVCGVHIARSSGSRRALVSGGPAKPYRGAMGLFLLIVRFALAYVFAVAALAKLRDAAGSRKSLAEFGVPAKLVPAFAVLLPLAELACAIALLRVQWAIPGVVGVIALLTVFIAVVALSLARGRAPECHCFGQFGSSRVSWRTLVRNLVLLALAGLVAWNANDIPSPAPAMPGHSVETVALAVIGVLAVVLGLTLWFLFHMLQQNGRLLLRLEAVEKRLNIDPNGEFAPGLPVGDPAPEFELKALEGGTMTSQTLAASNKTILLVFTEPNCGACEALQPELALWQREYAERLTIVPVSTEDVELNRTKNAVHGLRNVLLQVDREVALAYRVTATPSAVLVAEGRIASRIEAGSSAVRELVWRATLPLPVRKGDAVPSLKLPDLTGSTTDLADLRGRNTLLLFWNPFCGFCQKMLNEMRILKPGENTPELVVISSGSLEANREQSIPGKVLLDPFFGSGHVFGVTGTPSAVMLDKEGRVASEVGVGAPAVFALAGMELPASHLPDITFRRTLAAASIILGIGQITNRAQTLPPVPAVPAAPTKYDFEWELYTFTPAPSGQALYIFEGSQPVGIAAIGPDGKPEIFPIISGVAAEELRSSFTRYLKANALGMMPPKRRPQKATMPMFSPPTTGLGRLPKVKSDTNGTHVQLASGTRVDLLNEGMEVTMPTGLPGLPDTTVRFRLTKNGTKALGARDVLIALNGNPIICERKGPVWMGLTDLVWAVALGKAAQAAEIAGDSPGRPATAPNYVLLVDEIAARLKLSPGPHHPQ